MSTENLVASSSEPSVPRPVPAVKLIRAAQELFAQKGFADTSVQDITSAAETSVGTLYYHFGGKSELFQTIYFDYSKRQDDGVRQAIKAVRQAGVTDGRSLFLVGTRAYLTGVLNDRSMSRALSDGDAPSNFTTIRRAYGRAWEGRNARMLRLDPQNQADNALLSAISGTVGTWTRTIVDITDDDETETFIDEAISVMTRMIGFSDY